MSKFDVSVFAIYFWAQDKVGFEIFVFLPFKQFYKRNRNRTLTY